MLSEENEPRFKQILVQFKFNLKHHQNNASKLYDCHYYYLPQSTIKKIRGLTPIFAILFLDKILSRDVKVTHRQKALSQ